jgi:putative RNA 2'-phosphotransferase
MKRQYVHLSTTMERAREVASRRTREPVILSVRALDAHAAGVVFHSPEPQHFLARTIAPQFIEFPEI